MEFKGSSLVKGERMVKKTKSTDRVELDERKCLKIEGLHDDAWRRQSSTCLF